MAGLQATSPASASAAQPGTEFTSFLETWEAVREGSHAAPDCTAAGRGLAWEGVTWVVRGR